MAAIEESLSDLIQGYLSIWAQDTPLSGYLLNSPLLFSTSRATCHLLSAPGMIDQDYMVLITVALCSKLFNESYSEFSNFALSQNCFYYSKDIIYSWPHNNLPKT